MKNILFLIILIFALTACRPPADLLPPVPLPAPKNVEVSATPSPSDDYTDYDLTARIDGSTATIPLSESILLRKVGTFEGLYHTRTHNAYYRLINGDSDIIFVTYPSEDEFAMAEQHGVELEIVPVVKDALVFLCNAANPVQNLSSQQIRDIYTGKITDWGDVGGLKQQITPFQRPVNSGSQTLFLKLAMGEETPADPPLTLRPAEMGDLIDAVASYDNAQNALGYSVFYYVSDMYGSPDVRLMAVDGVMPMRDTIAADTYPYITHYYAVMRKDTPENHPVRELLDWILTDDGQYVAQEAGYVPMRVLPQRLDARGYGFYGSTPENTAQSSGTGGTAAKDPMTIEDLPETVKLSDLFYDGVNYIDFINRYIADVGNSNDYGFGYFYGIYDSPEEYSVKRPFTGIPHDYPHFSVYFSGGNSGTGAVLRIKLGDDNPFFSVHVIPDDVEAYTCDIPLPRDLSPWGLLYKLDYDRVSMSDNLEILIPKIQTGTEPSALDDKINAQIRAVADRAMKENELDTSWFSSDYVYKYTPTVQLEGEALTVFYSSRTLVRDYGYNDNEVLFSVTVNLRTGKA